jgi:hypothetical protein
LPAFIDQHEKPSFRENISVPGTSRPGAGQDAGAFGLAPNQSPIAIINWIVCVAFAVLRVGKPFDNRGALAELP